MQQYKYADLFFNLLRFFGLTKIPGAMQAFIFAAKAPF
jgi:hypothetical protein